MRRAYLSQQESDRLAYQMGTLLMCFCVILCMNVYTCMCIRCMGNECVNVIVMSISDVNKPVMPPELSHGKLISDHEYG